MNFRKSLDGCRPYKLPDATRHDRVRLDLNECPFGPSPKVIEAVRSLTPEEISMYPSPERFIKAASELYSNFGIAEENIIITNGADDAIRYIMDACLDENATVLMPEPMYSMYEILWNLRGANYIRVEYTKDWKFPEYRFIEEAKKGPDAIVLVDPASPTGEDLDEKFIKKVLEAAPDSFVILDETYFHFGRGHHLELLKKYSNLIIVHSMSKAYALAGMRLGLIFSRAENIEMLGRAAQPYPVSCATLAAGKAAIQDQDYLTEVVEKTKAEKQFLAGELVKLGIQAKDTATNFILADFGEDARRVHTELINRGILIRNITHRTVMKGILRISAGSRQQNIKFIDTIKDITDR